MALWSFCKKWGRQPPPSNRPTGQKTDCCIITDPSAGFTANQKGIKYSFCRWHYEVIFTEIQILRIHFGLFMWSTWSDSHRHHHNISHTTESALCYYYIRSSTRGQQIWKQTEAKVCSLWMHLQARQRESTASGDGKCFARRYISVFVCDAISGLYPLPQYLKVRSLRRPAHDHSHSPQYVECGSSYTGKMFLECKMIFIERLEAESRGSLCETVTFNSKIRYVLNWRQEEVFTIVEILSEQCKV